MQTNEDDPDFAARQEREAAAAAGAIGGRPPDLGGADTGERIDEAMRAVYEAGGGEAEGFELAEHDLVRNASHDDGAGYPERDAFTPEVETDLSGADFVRAMKRNYRKGDYARVDAPGTTNMWKTAMTIR